MAIVIQTAEELEARMEKVEKNYTKLLIGFAVLCGLSIIPELIRLGLADEMINAKLIVTDAILLKTLFLLLAYLSTRTHKSALSIATIALAIFNIPIGFTCITFFDALFEKFNITFETDLVFAPLCITLAVLMIMNNQSYTDIRTQQIRVIKRNEGLDRLRNAQEAAENRLQHSREEMRGKYGDNMADLSSNSTPDTSIPFTTNTKGVMDEI